MAGIGFELRKLLRSRSYLGLLRAYGYASLIGAGPWTFSILCLIALGGLSSSSFNSDLHLTQFQVLITYLIMSSLICTGGLQLGFTRWVADRLFERRHDAIVPAFFGVTLVVTAAAGTLGWIVAYWGFKGEANFLRLLLVFGFTLFANLWIGTVFLSGIKRYFAVVLLYGGGYALSVALARLGQPFGLSGLLLGFLIGQLGMWLGMLWLVLHQFPSAQSISLECFKPGQMYTSLFVGGTFYYLGMWVDKLVFWYTQETSSPIIGPLRFSMFYDLPLFLAYLCTIPAMGIFLMKFETDFAEWYEAFYTAVRKDGTLQQIVYYHDRMQDSVREGFTQILTVQAIAVLAAYAFAPQLFSMFGINAAYLPLFLVDTVAASFQVLLLAALNVFYYLDRRREVVIVSFTLAVLNFALSVLSIQLGPLFYGYGFGSAMLLTLLFALGLLQRLFRKLEYLTFMLQ